MISSLSLPNVISCTSQVSASCVCIVKFSTYAGVELLIEYPSRAERAREESIEASIVQFGCIMDSGPSVLPPSTIKGEQ
jgi:hypothetical protein